MVYLGGRSYYFDGVTVLPDHADPLQFYFLPLYPRITTEPGTNAMHLQLIKYRSDAAGNGGFLSIDVDLGIDDKTAIPSCLPSRWSTARFA
jgi:hypothetical protein